MAAEYEVNIKLNTKNVEQQLKNIDTRTKRTGKMATENINALVNAQDKRARLMNKINELEAKGLNVAQLRKQMGKATTELANRRFGTLEKEFRLLTRTLRLEESKLRILRQQQQGFPSSPIRGTSAIIGSPAEIAASARAGGARSPIQGAANIPGSPLARQASRQRLEQVGLGAGFPLLFGGGAGSVIGGGLGGLTGSFGAQIAFSAIGQQIDQFIASVGAVGTALTSASGTVEMFREKNLFSSDAVKEHAFQLEEQGKMQELATLLTKDLASQIGVNAVNNFQLLGDELKTFLGTINQLFLSVQGFVAGPLAKLLGAINTVLGGVSTDLQFGNLRRSLTGDAAAQFEAIIAETRGTRELSTQERQRAIRKGESTDPVEGRLTTTVKEAVLKDPRVAALRQTINVTGQTTLDDTLGFKPPKPPKPPRDREAERAKRLMERSRERIQLLGLEAKKIGEITVFKDKIAQAERDGDEQLVIRLNTERKLAEIASKEDKLITKLVQTDLPAEQKLREQIAIQTQSTAQANEAIAEGQRQLADFQQKEDQRRAQAMQKYIDQQYELNIAVQQQLALADGISNVMGQGMTQAFDALIDGAENWGRALQDIAANVLRDIARQLIQIYLIEQAVGFLSNFLTPFDSSTPLGAGGGQIGKFGTLGPNYGIPQFANGGTPPVGRPSIVGERGPELFIPGAKGTIVPNHAMGGANVTVNVDASGTQAQGNQPNAKLLGQAIGAAVQAELIKQKRPGGLLAA